MKKHKILHDTNIKLIHTAEQNDCIVVSCSMPQGMTCVPYADKCIVYCYASVGCQAYAPVRLSHERNYRLSLNPQEFITTVNKELNLLHRKGKPVVCRIHPSGEFYSIEYMETWHTITKQNPDVFFYCYSKAWVYLLNVFSSLITDNFVCIPSEGGKFDHLLGNRPRAYVVPVNATLFRPNSVWGVEDEIENLLAYVSGKSIGLAAHGVKKGKVKQ